MRTYQILTILVLGIAGALTTMALGPATSAAAPSFDEAPCPMELPIPDEAVRCGYVDVPANRDNSDNRTMRIAVAVFEATGSNPEADPLVFLPGGPAAPLLEFSWYDAALFAPVRESRDLVFFDHRGAGYSEPDLACPESIAVSRELLDTDLPNDEVNARFDAAWTACLTRLEGEGVEFADFNTTEVAADVVDVVDALGYQDFNTYGASYGTAVTQYLLRDHGGTIRSAVLDSVVPLPADLFADGGRSFQDSLYTMFAECAADAACRAAYPDLETMYWVRVINQGNLTPFSVEVTNPDTGAPVMTTVNGFDILYFTFVALYDTSRIPSLPRLIHDIANGNTESLSELAQLQFAFEDIPVAAHTAVYCNEEVYFTTQEDLERGAEGLRGEIYATFQYFPPDGVLPILEDCTRMGIDGPRAPIDDHAVGSSRPALVLSGQYDPITPPHYAEQVTGTLTNNSYYEFRATGHGAAYGRTDCAMTMISGFIDDPAAEIDGACVAAIPAITWELPAGPPPTPTAAPQPTATAAPAPPTGAIVPPDTGAGPIEGRSSTALWMVVVGLTVAGLGVALVGAGKRRSVLH